MPGHFALELIKSIFTVSICLSTTVYSSSSSTSQTALCFLPDSPHLFPYAGHIQDGWLDLDTLHVFVWIYCGLCVYFSAFLTEWHKIPDLLLFFLDLVFMFFEHLLILLMEILDH